MADMADDDKSDGEIRKNGEKKAVRVIRGQLDRLVGEMWIKVAQIQVVQVIWTLHFRPVRWLDVFRFQLQKKGFLFMWWID